MLTKDFQFENGVKVREKITGFEGIITGTCFYLTGCTQYLITGKPKDKFSEPVSLWYDEGRIEFIKQKFTAKDVESEINGCDIVPTIGKRGM